MADTRNEIYSAAGAAANQPCESKESSSKLVAMKVNSAESNGKEEKKESDTEKSFSPGGRAFPSSKSDNPILSSPRFGSAFGTKSFALRQSAFGSSKFASGSTSSCLASSPKPIVLRPSQLAVGSSEVQQTSILSSATESRVNNPFARVPGVTDDSSEAQSKDTEKTKLGDSVANSDANKQNSPPKSNIQDTSSHKTDSPANSLLASPKFVPLGTPVNQKDESSSSGTVTNPSSGVSGFVFGQNLHERVEVTKSEVPETSNSGTDLSDPTPSSSASTNGTSEMLFSSVIRKELGTEEKSGGSSSDSGERPSKSLSEAAREYEEARAVKRKYEEVAVVTGEEDEANVLQLNCKLFAFDKSTSTWVERGRGNLRLNDMDGPEGLQSRVVIRTTGSLRVVLNTKIWAGMVVDRASAKSVRLTAMDNTGQIKVFLVMASPKEIEQLHQALTSRVARKQQCKASKTESSGSQQSVGYEDAACNSSLLEPVRKRPSLLQDAGGGNEPKM